MTTNNASATAGASQSQFSGTSTQQDIAKLAYALWQSQGCPQGSAEADWFEAERKVRQSTERHESTETRR